MHQNISLFYKLQFWNQKKILNDFLITASCKKCLSLYNYYSDQPGYPSWSLKFLILNSLFHSLSQPQPFPHLRYSVTPIPRFSFFPFVSLRACFYPLSFVFWIFFLSSSYPSLQLLILFQLGLPVL